MGRKESFKCSRRIVFRQCHGLTIDGQGQIGVVGKHPIIGEPLQHDLWPGLLTMDLRRW
jgi:hypothetical protein